MSQVQYEVIMTDIGHTMQRDGETIVFGDVMFATPNDGRSRISSYGQGADKASARQALIDRAIEHLQREEFNVEEKIYPPAYKNKMTTSARCGITGLPYNSWHPGSSNGVCPLLEPSATNDQIEDWIAWMSANYDDWYPQLRGAIIELNKDETGFNLWWLTPEDLEVYNAEGNYHDFIEDMEGVMGKYGEMKDFDSGYNPKNNLLKARMVVEVDDEDFDNVDFDAESKKSKKKPSKSAAPVEVVNNRQGFFDDEQDKEYFGFGFIVGGIIVGVLGTIFGNIFSELVLDEMRVNKFGYRDSSQTESSFWELDSA